MLSSFSDASHPEDRSYGQTGVIIGIRRMEGSNTDTYHVIDWKSHPQKRESYSAYGAEILACAMTFGINDRPGWLCGIELIRDTYQKRRSVGAMLNWEIKGRESRMKNPYKNDICNQRESMLSYSDPTCI